MLKINPKSYKKTRTFKGQFSKKKVFFVTNKIYLKKKQTKRFRSICNVV